ncbi:hypothetical protein QAD02_015388, partial [Eretmocerus hayati]
MLWWSSIALVLLLSSSPGIVVRHVGGTLKREADYTLDDSFWNEETPAGEVERLLRQYQQNEELVNNIKDHFYQIIYPVQLRHHEKMGISTREAGVPRYPQKGMYGENGYSGSRSKSRTGKHFHRTALLIKAFNHKFRLDLELNTQLLAPNLVQKDFLVNGAEQVSKQEIEHCYYHGTVKDYPGASAAFHTCNGVSGVIHLGNETFVIHPFYGGDMSKHPHVIFEAKTKASKGCANSGNLEWRSKARRQKHISESDFGRYKRDVREVTKYIETALFIDKAMFDKRNGSTRAEVVHDIIQVANIADLYFRTLNTRVSVVYIETWQGGNQIDIDKNTDISRALHNFNNYMTRNSFQISHDTAQLLTGENFVGGESGIAAPDTACTEKSLSISVDINTYEPHLLAGTMAHMIGHNIGMSHDDGRSDCRCHDWHGCIMAQSIVGLENVQPYKFSECSKADYISALRDGKDVCLLNKPNELEVGRLCGNRVVDDGEDCDCGSLDECEANDPCCDAITCKLVREAECASGPCCHDCKLQPKGSVCREATNECDLPEVCTGEVGRCPTDVHKKNGHLCADGAGSCFNGFCPALNFQCQQIWGSEGTAADTQCFEQFNSKGSINGHCGTDSSGHFIKCEAQNVRCGLLQCQDGSKQPVIDGVDALYSRTIISIKGREYECKATTEELEVKGTSAGFGLVRDGTPCGENLICLNQTCTNQFPHIDSEKCPSNNNKEECSGHGACDNVRKCHCDRGWSGPDCSIKQEIPEEELTTSSTETPSISTSSKNKMERKETPYENYHGSNTVYLVATLMTVVGGVFIIFAGMALCYRSVVVHKNFSLCLRKKNTVPKFDPPYSKKPVPKNYSGPAASTNPEIAALDSVHKILKFGRMPHYREHKPQMTRLRHEEDDGGAGTEEVVSFIDLPPNSMAKPERGILKKQVGYGLPGSGGMSDAERALNGYHDDILEVLRNAHRDFTAAPSGSGNLLDDEMIRKSLADHGFSSDYRKGSDSHDNADNMDDDDDEEELPPTCGTIRIRTLEDIIRQLENHSTRHMSPVDSEDIRISENENDRHYRMDSSVCSESSQGSRRCSRTRDDDTRFVYGRYRQPASRSPFGHHQHSRQLHEEEGLYETADPDRNPNARGDTPDSE